MATVTDTATDAAAELQRAMSHQPMPRSPVKLANGERSGTTRSFVIGGAATHRGALLHAVQRALTARGATMQAIASVDVVPGPGRFSAVRLGVTTANAIAWALGVPLYVQGKKVRVAVPEYGAEPSARLPTTDYGLPPIRQH